MENNDDVKEVFQYDEKFYFIWDYTRGEYTIAFTQEQLKNLLVKIYNKAQG